MSQSHAHNHTHNHTHSNPHQHSHSHAFEAEHQGRSNIQLAFFLNLGFAILEIIGGLITGSTAILSDAAHDFGDSFSLALSYFFEKSGRKSPTTKYTYGFKRLSVVGALINSIVLSVGTVFVLFRAIDSILDPKPVMAEGMLLMAVLGIGVNGFSILPMLGAKKILDKTVMLHLLEDLLGWVAVLFVSIGIFFTKWYLLDPILSLIICFVVARNIFLNVKNTIEIIMQAVPDAELYEEVKEHFLEVKGVTGILELHIWSLDGEENVMAATVMVEDNCESNLLNKLKEIARGEGIKISTIELRNSVDKVEEKYV